MKSLLRCPIKKGMSKIENTTSVMAVLLDLGPLKKVRIPSWSPHEPYVLESAEGIQKYWWRFHTIDDAGRELHVYTTDRVFDPASRSAVTVHRTVAGWPTRHS